MVHGSGRDVIRTEFVCIGDGHIKKKTKYVFVILSVLETHVV